MSRRGSLGSFAGSRAATVLLAVFAVVVLAGAGYVVARPLPKPGGPVAHYTPPTASPTPQVAKIHAPKGSRVVFLGDSWTMGYGVTPRQAYPALASAKLGWNATVVPNGSGTGYLNKGPDGAGTYQQRLAKQGADPNVDLLVIQGGLNDAAVSGVDSGTRLNKAVRKTIDLGETKYPGARIVLMGPLNPMEVEPTTTITAVDDRLAFEAKKAGLPYISPTEDGWFQSAAQLKRYINKATDYHPSVAGQAYLAHRFEAAIARLSA